MRKKLQQIISFTIALLLIVSSVDISVWAVELSSAETEEEQAANDLEENEETSDQEEKNTEIDSLETTETQTEETLTEDTAVTDTEEMITSDIESDTVIETKVDNATEESSSTENDLQEETETESTESKEILTAEETKIELIPKLEMEIGQEKNILINTYPKDLNEEDIIWDSSNWEIAIVENGIVTASDVGEATITAKIRETNIEAKCLVIVSDINFETENFSSYSNTRNTSYYDGYGAVAWAKDHNNSDINKNYGTGSCPNNWLCAEFVARAAINGGGLNSQCLSASCTYLRSKLLNGGYCTEYTAQLSNGYLMKNNFSGTIAVGDIVLYKCQKNHSRPFPHAVMFAGWSSDGKMLVYAHNSRKNGEVIQYTKCSVREPNNNSPRCNALINEARVLHFNGNTASSESVKKLSPIGNLDGIEGGKGTVTLVGWAADPDDYAKDVEIHIYVGGNIGTGSLYNVTANNALRSDVKQEHPLVKENCGFNYTFKVNERGTQEVYVYALDTQGTSLNTLIGHTTISIANPDPVIRIDPDSMQLNVNDTKKLTVSYQLSEIYQLKYYTENADIVSAKWGTPADGKCDLNIKGLKRGNATVDIQLWNEAETTLIYSETIPITVTELSVEFSQDTVETNLNEIKTFEFSFAGSDLYGLECDIGDRSITDLTDWRWNENHNGTISIKGYKEGTTNLTLHIMGINNTVLFTNSIPITVMKSSTSFGQNSMEIGINKTEEITFSFRGANLQEVNLDIADQSIATLEHWEWDANNDGIIRIKGHKKGSTTMTLYIVGADGSRISSKTIPLTVKDSLSGIALNASSKELTVGGSFQLAVSYIPSTAKPEGSVRWSSSNTGVATVDTRGWVKALKKGTTEITASVDGFQKKCSITVVEKQVPVTGIYLNTTDMFIEKGTQYTLKVNYTPSNANKNIPNASDIVWSSQNTKIATVSNGVITAINSGSTIITAKYGIYSATCKVSVMRNEEESSEVEESSTTEESSSREESSSTEESSEVEESSSREESSEVEESSSSEESSSTEESSSEKETSPYNDKERTDLSRISGKIASIKAKTYDGNTYTPAVKVTVNSNGRKITLVEGTDYTVEYRNNVNAGEGTVIVSGNGIYKGRLTSTFTINPKSVKKLKAYADDMVVDSMSEPTVHIFDGAKRLVNGKDYTLEYDRELTGYGRKSADVKIVAKGNYKDTRTVKLTVYDGSTPKFFVNASLDQTQFAYTGKAIKPKVTVMVSRVTGDETLRLNKDYKVQYQNNVNAGTAYVIVTGKGQYKGKTVVSFEIMPRDAADTTLTISKIPDKTYNRKLQKPSVTVKNGKKKLVKDKDYTISYTGNLHVSTDSKKAKVIITGKGNYAGITAQAEFIIKPQKISKAVVKGTQENLTVTYGRTKLKEGVHYTVASDVSSAKNNKIKVTITGLGDFAGSTVTKNIKSK